MKTVMITGAAGFLGRYAAQHFTEQGWSVIGIDCVEPANAPLYHFAGYYKLKLPNKGLGELLRSHAPELCVHCAGIASVPQSVSDPAADYFANAVVTFELLNTLRLNAPRCRFILMSSAAVYGNPRLLPVHEEQPAAPISPYGFHKLQCEQMCQEFSGIFGVPTASVRIFSAYGQGLHRQVIWDICRKVLMHTSLTLQGTGSESRDFIHALDVARALGVIAENAPLQGEVYNVASGCGITIRDLAAMILDALNADILPSFDGEVPAGTPLNWEADISRLRALGFAPAVTLQQGIRTVAQWCRTELSLP